MNAPKDPTKRYKPLPPRAQRWSASFPEGCSHFYMAIYGVQMAAPEWTPPATAPATPDAAETARRAAMSDEERQLEDKWRSVVATNDARNARLLASDAYDAEKLASSPIFNWVDLACTSRFSPGAYDHSRYFDEAGFITHVFVCYWTNRERFEAFRESRAYVDFWEGKDRTGGDFGYFREEMTIPLERQETVYFWDYIVGIGRCESTKLVKTFDTGYYGSMRDRIPAARIDGIDEPLREPVLHASSGARIQVHPDEYVTMIRSGQFWKRTKGEQRAHYFDQLQPAVNGGMNYIRDNPVETGCCSVRYMQNCDVNGKMLEEGTGLAMFKTISYMESWAKGHASHEKIYTIAKQQLMKKDFVRELRTYHEVAVLPDYGQFFEYCNCHPMTGLLPWFEVTVKA